MKKNGFISLIFSLFSLLPLNGQAAFNYDATIHLDAEDLAEAGIKEIYEKGVLPQLRLYVEHPASIEEILDNDNGSYSVVANGKQYDIYGVQIEEYDSWGYATYSLFDIVNRQLASSDRKFYAFYAGNDLSGMFLTAEEYQRCVDDVIQKKAAKYNLPYFPTMETPWFGQPHD
ncbi:hypothetical protein SOASR030_28120 [Leminorella grimontii]|uniref:Uncharacterized protein n=1 Tax=Leminorella grimontii TaxID=82981 RepID=A0AAV5N3M4_9GAMM|nr:hypothetical protein [Leminorella grimontii]KFC94603.1 hypothetical protein GLGR_2720 [Leminorella grimontii ATCC 33999 = DSM 5078]GKX56700.1 hypothetical protein SOASR030_28120 [Leminorella grimontii]GKX59700.1 hypothetical protein SOASR031_20150 [Leminorella grimontii]VFS61994.1 Uncharacterised protein [Leminorella grimontii]